VNARRRTALVVLAALLGIALAAAITWGTSQLVRQRIGLASEPLTAGRRLLPVAVRPAQEVPTTSSTRTRSHASSTTTVTATTTTVTIAPPPASAPTVTVPPVEATPPVAHRPEGGGGDSRSQRDD
jgi:hypothetical protein